MGLLDRLKTRLAQFKKIEADYGLEKLIREAEQIPIYLNENDFEVSSYAGFVKYAKSISADMKVLKKLAEAGENLENRFRIADKTSAIERIFNPVLAKMAIDLAYGKDAQRLAKIKEEYRQVEKTKQEYKTRARLWVMVGEKMVESMYLGASIDEKFKKRVLQLAELEEKYSPYNGGRGIETLERAVFMAVEGKAIEVSELAQSNKKSIQEYFDEVKSIRQEENEEKNMAKVSTREEIKYVRPKPWRGGRH